METVMVMLNEEPVEAEVLSQQSPIPTSRIRLIQHGTQLTLDKTRQ